MTVDLIIGGKPVQKAETIPLVSPGSGKVVDKISKGTGDDVKAAVEAANGSFETWSDTPLSKRTAVLLKVAQLLRERLDDFALTLATEAGKPIRDSRVEVIINDSTRLRWDALPFGGRKKTGFGREGVRDTMLEMTEQKLVSLNLGE